MGNRLTENGGAEWQYNANNELLGTPEASFTYDANGHTTSKTEGGQTTRYSYNLAERLTSVSIDGGTTLGSYTYDPFGRRIKKVTSAGTRYFHYDDTGLLAVYDGTGALLEEYQYRPGSPWMTNPLFKRDAGSGMHYYVNDHLGRSLYLVDASGRVTWKGRSQAFGETVVEVEVVENNLRFPGQYYDQETGLFYNFWRYYSQDLGRYMQEDRIGLSGDINLYVYAVNNGLAYTDSDGRVAHVAVMAILGAACSVAAGYIASNGDYSPSDAAKDAAAGAAGALGGGARDLMDGCGPSSRVPEGALTGGAGDAAGSAADARRQVNEANKRRYSHRNPKYKARVGGLVGCALQVGLSIASR